MRKIKGLRRRWLINTVGFICALGLVCVLLVTAGFSFYFYSSMESDLRYRVETTTEFLSANQNRAYDEFYQSCITYAQSFSERSELELQFADPQGKIIASSNPKWEGCTADAADIAEAVSTCQTQSFTGRDILSGKRILAVAGPMIYDGAVIGVLRYVTPTITMDRQIALTACIAFAALLIIIAGVLFSSNYYIHSILVPLHQIIERAKMITSGSYGIQIQTDYDDEIGELAQTINEMSMQINRNEKAQTEFISSLSHELRTPLTAITGWSETLLSSEDLDEGTRRGVKVILSEGRRLTEMVVELLDFTKIQDGRMTLNMEPTDIRSEFEDTVFMYGSRLAQEGIRINYLENDDEIPEISCDPKRLRQVFLNILDNAAKHGGEGKVIDASLSWEEDFVIARIRDYGPGIPEDELSLVKNKFYKGSSKARGSGIGLAVCEEIVQMHGGTLTLENADGGGTLVTVELPA